MRPIIIMITITDAETLEAYADVHPDLIADDVVTALLGDWASPVTGDGVEVEVSNPNYSNDDGLPF